MEEPQGSRFGAALRRAREGAGRSIAEVAGTTRIPERHLAALEEERWDALPGGVTGRGFVRLLAKELGLPDRELLDAYRQARGKEPEARLAPPEQEWTVDFRRERGSRPLLLVVLLLLGSALGVWVWSPWTWGPSPAPSPAPGSVAEEPPRSLPAPAPLPQAAESPPTLATVREPEPPPAAPAAAPDLHRLEVLAVEAVWVRAVADGGTPEERTLQPGQTLAVEVRHQVSLRLGNAGGVRLTWNGESLRAPGPRGGVLTLVLPEALESLRP